MFKITKRGEYKTRNGKKVIVLLINEYIPGRYQVVGYVDDGERTGVDTWTVGGIYSLDRETNDIDIVSDWREPMEVDCYMIGIPHPNGKVILDNRRFDTVEEASEYCNSMYYTASVLRITGREILNNGKV